MKESGIVPKRTIYVAAFTGEESAGYGMALFGSKGMFHGLTDAELDSRNEGGSSIREMLGPENSRKVRSPLFGSHPSQLPMPEYAIEMHVEQFKSLHEDGIDLGVVEAIAAPNRFQVEISEPESKTNPSEVYSDFRYLRLEVDGMSGHSGATPMGEEYRADGLVDTSSVLETMAVMANRSGVQLDVATIDIDGGAINKIPGRVRAALRLAGNYNNQSDIDTLLGNMQYAVDSLREYHAAQNDAFAGRSIILSEMSSDDSAIIFDPSRNYQAYRDANVLIDAVACTAEQLSSEGVVGTVGTYSTREDGTIVLGLDIRGREVESRKQAIEQIAEAGQVDLSHPLPGATDPVELDGELADLLIESTESARVATVKRIVSPAGHDAQNAAAAGVKTGLLFTQSERGGAAHNPEAYTSPENLAKGTRAVALATMRLAA